MLEMIIGRSLTPLDSSRTLRALRRRETVRRSDDNSRRKVQNVWRQLRLQTEEFTHINLVLPVSSAGIIACLNAR